jgi:hypothetical protein
LYNFETVVPFEILPLRLDAEIPAPLPMLETLSEIFNRNAVKGLDSISVGSGVGIAASSRAGGVLRRGLKFQTCTNTLNELF